jgi:hypothetical protein
VTGSWPPHAVRRRSSTLPGPAVTGSAQRHWTLRTRPLTSRKADQSLCSFRDEKRRGQMNVLWMLAVHAAVRRVPAGSPSDRKHAADRMRPPTAVLADPPYDLHGSEKSRVSAHPEQTIFRRHPASALLNAADVRMTACESRFAVAWPGAPYRRRTIRLGVRRPLSRSSFRFRRSGFPIVVRVRRPGRARVLLHRRHGRGGGAVPLCCRPILRR